MLFRSLNKPEPKQKYEKIKPAKYSYPLFLNSLKQKSNLTLALTTDVKKRKRITEEGVRNC